MSVDAAATCVSSCSDMYRATTARDALSFIAPRWRLPRAAERPSNIESIDPKMTLFRFLSEQNVRDLGRRKVRGMLRKSIRKVSLLLVISLK